MIRSIRNSLDSMAGRRVFCRFDLNAPMIDCVPIDESRIRSCVETLTALAESGARSIVATHLGYPKGQADKRLSTVHLVSSIHRHSGLRIEHMDSLDFEDIRRSVDEMADGHAILLENVRFHPGEEKDELSLAQSFASLADIYVNDAFSVCHRKHASVTGVPRLLEAYAGLGLERESKRVGRVMGSRKENCGLLMGGNKLDKLEMLPKLVNQYSVCCVGGVLGFILSGVPESVLIASNIDPLRASAERLSLPEELLVGCSKIAKPVDAIVSCDDGSIRTVKVEELFGDMQLRDIGPRTISSFVQRLRDTFNLVWNGPLGNYENSQYCSGTLGVVGALLDQGLHVVCGGGDTLAACAKLKITSRMGHCSTGGGALLRLLADGHLPGLDCLNWDSQTSDGATLSAL